MSELLLFYVGFLVPLGLFAATRFLNNRKSRRERIREVARGYGELCHGAKPLDCGPRAFLKAGARELRSNEEIRSAVGSVVDRWGLERHPLGSDWRELDDIDLKSLVDQLSDNAENFEDVCAALSANRSHTPRGALARIRKVLAWAPAGEGFRRVAVLVALAGSLGLTVNWFAYPESNETALHTLIACQPRPDADVQAELAPCDEHETLLDRFGCRLAVEETECSEVAWKLTHLALGLLLAPLYWLLTWLAAQTVFGALAWVVRGFMHRN